MCLEDIRLGRRSQSSMRSVNVSNVAPTPIAPANPRRTRLFISANESQSLRIGSSEVPPTGTIGIGLAQGQQFILLRIEDIGTAIQGAWSAQATLANTNVVVIDVSLDEK